MAHKLKSEEEMISLSLVFKKIKFSLLRNKNVHVLCEKMKNVLCNTGTKMKLMNKQLLCSNVRSVLN